MILTLALFATATDDAYCMRYPDGFSRHAWGLLSRLYFATWHHTAKMPERFHLLPRHAQCLTASPDVVECRRRRAKEFQASAMTAVERR